MDVEILFFRNFSESYSGVYVCEREVDGVVMLSKNITISQKRKFLLYV